MAIAFDNSNSGTSTSSATNTFSLVVGSGANRILWVGFLVNNGTTPTVSSVTYAGVAMTATSNSPVNGGQYLYLYSLAAPATGTNNVVITMSGSVSQISACASSYTGAAQTGIPDSVTSVHSTGTSATTTTTTVADNSWMVGIFRNDSTGNGSAGSGTTHRTSVAGQVSMDDSGSAFTPAGSHSIQETWAGSNNYYAISASFAPLPIISVTVSYLIVAGAGGVGGTGATWTAGSGAGGLLNSTATVSSAVPYTVTVGNGGTAGANNVDGGTGGNSLVNFDSGTITSLGGAGSPGANGVNGFSGGSGSGGTGASSGTGGTGTGGQGNNGGTAGTTFGGGGGGATGAGGSGASAGGTAGAGLTSSVTGSSVTYAQGGVGGATGNSSTANTGNGAGGPAKAGSTGVVLIYAPIGAINVASTTGGTHTTSGGNDIWTFTSSGTWTPIVNAVTTNAAFILRMI